MKIQAIIDYRHDGKGAYLFAAYKKEENLRKAQKEFFLNDNKTHPAFEIWYNALSNEWNISDQYIEEKVSLQSTVKRFNSYCGLFLGKIQTITINGEKPDLDELSLSLVHISDMEMDKDGNTLTINGNDIQCVVDTCDVLKDLKLQFKEDNINRY
jgi:hypothetical protein